jgi:hypothetical protein
MTIDFEHIQRFDSLYPTCLVGFGIAQGEGLACGTRSGGLAFRWVMIRSIDTYHQEHYFNTDC